MFAERYQAYCQRALGTEAIDSCAIRAFEQSLGHPVSDYFRDVAEAALQVRRWWFPLAMKGWFPLRESLETYKSQSMAHWRPAVGALREMSVQLRQAVVLYGPAHRILAKRRKDVGWFDMAKWLLTAVVAATSGGLSLLPKGLLMIVKHEREEGAFRNFSEGLASVAQSTSLAKRLLHEGVQVTTRDAASRSNAFRSYCWHILACDYCQASAPFQQAIAVTIAEHLGVSWRPHPGKLRGKEHGRHRLLRRARLWVGAVLVLVAAALLLWL